jgi:hypothetical protein
MDFLSTLFPNDPAYDGLLSVERVKALQRNQLLQAGVGMLGDTTGASPMQTGPALAKNVGGAMQQFPQQIQQAAESAARMQQYQQQQNVLATRRNIISMFPEGANETPQDTGARLMKMLPHFVRAGDMDMVGKLTELLKSMKFGEGPKEGTPHAGMHKMSDGTLVPQEFVTNEEGKATWLTDPQGNPIAPVVDSSAKDALALQHETLRAMPLVSHYDAETKDLRTAHLYGLQGLQQANAAVAGDPASQYALFHAFLKLNDPQAVVRPGTAQLVSEAMSMYQKINRWTQSYLEGKSALMDPSFTRQVARVTADQVRDLERRWNDEYNRTLTRAKLAQVPEGYFEPPDMTPEDIIAPWAPKAARRSPECQRDITKC